MSNLYCGNCGKKGHIYKNCYEPVISIGIICIKFDNNDINNSLYEKINKYDEKILNKNIKYLMISRKNSIGYVEFMRGKYLFDEIEYLQLTLNIMTQKEQNLILNKTFDENWEYLWSNSDINKNNDYINSKKKFNKFKKKNYKYLINKNKDKWIHPEWGFPKGRRNLRELNIECAKREFLEETNIDESNYTILDMRPLEENYIGTNGIRYKHIYYIAQIKKEIKLEIDLNNLDQKGEVGILKWCNIKEANSLIRHYNIEKKKIINNLHKMLLLLYK